METIVLSGTESLSETESATEITRPAVNHRIHARTLHDVTRYIGADPVFIDERIRELEREWTLERTLEVKTATMGLAGLLLGLAVDRRFLALTGIASALLLQQALQGWSPAQPLLRRFGLRTAEEIHEEIIALRILRGDFLERIDYPERALANARSWV
ncbi:MAG: hypothetical protein ABI821_06305 [Pseudomonadota bacterium]